MTLFAILNIVQVVFGIGLVIFVHELGHFLAARWCGARVEIFSLGFGPRIFGVQRGDTMFQVAAVPLGGFVKVAGEYHDGTTAKEEGTLSSLNVWQRFLYYSGGVIMNVIFAFIVMPLVMFAGMPANSPVIGEPQPGHPAWEAGVPSGSEVLEVNGEDITDFEHLVTAIAVNGKDPVELVVQPPAIDGAGAAIQTYQLTPKFDEDNGLYRIGVPHGPDPSMRLTVISGSVAETAGLRTGDRLLAVLGQPAGLSLARQWERVLMAKSPMALRVLGEDGAEREVTITPEIKTTSTKRIGIAPLVTRVAAVRDSTGAPAWIGQLGMQVDDVLLEVEGLDVYTPRDIENAFAGILTGEPAAPDASLTVTVERAGQIVDLVADAPSAEEAMRFFDFVGLDLADGTLVNIDEDSDSAATRAGLLSGDRILNVDGEEVESWGAVLTLVRAAIKDGRPLALVIERYGLPSTRRAQALGSNGSNIRVTLSGAPVDSAEYGFALSAATMTLKADSFGEAVTIGTRATKRFLIQVWLQLKKMIFSDEISTKNLGGIISISMISYDTASQGMAKFFFFLALLSVNLAIINLLPIPILDGGHLFFLLIEAIKGSPVSERAFGYSQVVGLVMIMSLMVYVTYQDIVRWFLQ